MNRSCLEAHLTSAGRTRRCVRARTHEGVHMDEYGDTWAPPAQVLAELTARWGRTHKIAWTGRFWLATHHHPRAPWRSQIEPTPEQLESRLRAHYGMPPGPPAERTKRRRDVP